MTANLALINDVQLRFLCADDVEEVKRLCREWFPIEYPDTWYNEITTNPRFFSLAATHAKAIIGLVVAEVKPRLMCNKEDSGILEYTYQDNYQVAYILSIGVAKEYRRQKIGSLLLDSLISNLTTPEQQDCKAIYLHVLSSNMAAIRFYETRCFRMFSYLPMYYAINGTQRDGCLYVLYINGGKPPWTFSDAIKYAGSKLVNLKPCKLPMYILNSLYGWVLWFSPVQSVRDSCVRIM
ncbi:N-alpha-acetyltransferase 60-like [Exaiptasia diaphana]|uniref:N-alpha-acetyltransferase 60 n=1 Tax=Exaiptasia diaphana TaxID=2652724 RepID=A0A913XHT0_EXADI|nr:N-alpha-acetyltransferase 60-like [Exaiptasia diaphana]